MNSMYDGDEERQAAIPPSLQSPTPDPVPEEAKEDENDNPPAETADKQEEVQIPDEPSKPVLVGSFALQVVEAKLTRDTESFSKMDPYCKVYMAEGEQAFKTETKDGAGKAPVWNETFTFEVTNLTDDLLVEVHEADPVNDDLIGDVKIDLSQLCVDEVVDRWFAIIFEEKSAGQVHLISTWTPSQPLKDEIPPENMPDQK